MEAHPRLLPRRRQRHPDAQKLERGVTVIKADDPNPEAQPSGLTIRPAVAADAAALDALERAVFSAENYPLSRRSFYYHIRRNLLLVAENEDGTVKGYILALIRQRVPRLYSLAVAPDFRNRGIASMLLEQMLNALEARGFEHVTLEVRSDSDAAIALYRRVGFETVKTLKGFYRDGCDAYLMRR